MKKCNSDSEMFLDYQQRNRFSVDFYDDYCNNIMKDVSSVVSFFLIPELKNNEKSNSNKGLFTIMVTKDALGLIQLLEMYRNNERFNIVVSALIDNDVSHRYLINGCKINKLIPCYFSDIINEECDDTFYKIDVEYQYENNDIKIGE